MTRRLGEGARIVRAEKIRRGGVGGFFARELVQLTAAPAGSDADGEPEASASGDVAADRPGTVDRAPAAPPADPDLRAFADADPRVAATLRAVLEADEHDDDTFGALLRRELGDDDGSAGEAEDAAGVAETRRPRPTRPSWRTTRSEEGVAFEDVIAPAQSQRPAASGGAVAVREPASVPEQVAVNPVGLRPGDPAWGATTLYQLGLPARIVESAASLRPVDDCGWTAALARALEGLCGPLPCGPQLLVGPRAARLGRALGMATLTVGAELRTRRDVCLAQPATAKVRDHLERLRGDRVLHVMAGGRDWRGLLFFDPDVISWTTADGLLGALTAAADLGLTLGWALSEQGSVSTRRPTPMDVAVMVRDLLPRIPDTDHSC